MRLDRACFEEHIASGPFQDGVARGYWGVASRDRVDWPHVLIWTDLPARSNSPDRLFLRFHLQDYPSKGPTAVPWDFEKNEKLEIAKWPKGNGDVAKVFRTDWEGAVALYAPWDRFTVEKHDANWLKNYPGFEWNPSRTIIHYLRLTREVLHCDDYSGC
jgi:hypothetical protein